MDVLFHGRPKFQACWTYITCVNALHPTVRSGGISMKRSTERILDHAGSLARPTELLDTLKERESRRPYDAALLDRQVRDAVADRCAGRSRTASTS